MNQSETNMPLKNIGRYQIRQTIGEGGMAVVYLAYDPKLGRDVAIKVLHPQKQNVDFQQSFDQEARILAKLEHPNILPIHDYGEDNGQAYIVTRYIAHGSLKYKLANGSLSPKETRRILTKIASALSLAHKRGIIHRDIKSSNILIDGNNEPLLADFGIARFMEETKTVTDIGTPPYMAPEQWQQKRIGAYTDVYQLGIMLFEMLTGQRPFSAESKKAYEESHLTTAVPPIHQVNPSLSPAYDSIIQKATAKDPAQRYQTPNELADAFAQVVSPNPNAQRGLKWIGGIVAGILILMALSWFWKGRTVEETAVLPLPTATSEIAALPQPTDTPSPVPTTVTHLPSPTAESVSATDSAMVPETLDAGATKTRAQDGMPMRFVPGGNVTLGVDEADLTALTDQCALSRETSLCLDFIEAITQPTKQVTLPDFWLDETEVSNQQYALCVAAGACAIPSHLLLDQQTAYYENPDFANHPMLHTNWDEARTYCQWAGGDLPDEDQWEYAARGDSQSLYPWGDAFNGNKTNYCDQSCTFSWHETNYDDGSAQTAPVTANEMGLSWVNAINMAGNVWEWTRSDLVLPTEPNESTGEKVIRGGSWVTNSHLTSSAIRQGLSPETANDSTGFRCATKH